MAGSRERRWEEGENAMKKRKINTSWQNDNEKLKRHDRVAVIRLRTGYTRTTHLNKMEGTPDPDCSFCSVKLTREHILWQCKKTEEEIRKSNMARPCGRKEKNEQKCW
jgi:hypothetical protein